MDKTIEKKIAKIVKSELDYKIQIESLDEYSKRVSINK
jgi:hypothetical protein